MGRYCKVTTVMAKQPAFTSARPALRVKISRLLGPPAIAFLMILCTSPVQAQTSKHLPIYDSENKFLYGEVRLEDGASPPGLVAVEGICGGVAYPIGFADTQGNFRIPLISGGPRFMSNSGPRFDHEHQFTAELILRDFSC